MTDQPTIERLFSYGTLQLERVQLATFGRLLNGVADQLSGYRLEQVEIRDPAVLATSGLQFHPMLVWTGRSSDRVAGTVLELTGTELEQADRYEVSDYRRAKADLASGGWAWVYVDARLGGASS